MSLIRSNNRRIKNPKTKKKITKSRNNIKNQRKLSKHDIPILILRINP